MKKEYIKPIVTTTPIKYESNLMAGTVQISDPGGGSGETPDKGDIDPFGARGTHDIWVDVWED